MIKVNNEHFIIETKNLSYIFHHNKLGYLVNDYFGDKVNLTGDFNALGLKEAFAKGTTPVVDKDVDPQFASDNQLLEFSFAQKGDYKEPAIIIKNDSRGYTYDFRYLDYSISDKVTPLVDLPNIHDVSSELIVRLKEQVLDIIIELHYIISDNHDCIVRSTTLVNNTTEELIINKICSMQFDLINNKYHVVNLNGSWITETHASCQKIYPGIYINDSKTGNSSNKHNPFFLIHEEKATDDYGSCYGFNLIYSGNHQELVELSVYDHLHIQSGINPYMLNYHVNSKEVFQTPYALMSYSSKGLNALSHRMHDFINDCIVNANFRYYPRPILINNWEGTYFKFTESKLLSIARAAKKFGVELFVLDDGWFSTRNDDTQGLGDYDVNTKKLPHGITGLAKRINDIGLDFGLWMEPESINPNSKLYKAHPDWAIAVDGIKPNEARNQYILDLTNKEVQDYIISNIEEILSTANIKYIKWDMNRNITDIPGKDFDAGEFYFRYMKGLYRILLKLTTDFPHVLFENCASGGNRLDLGMLSFFPQTWASDDSDPYERISIQEGLSYGYPQSCYSCHVSHRQNHQVLRDTPYSTKFCVAAFGVLGYELMLNELSDIEQREIKKEIAFYKEHRNLFQYGHFYRLKNKEYPGDSAMWMIKAKDNSEAIVGYFNGVQTGRPHETVIRNLDLDENALYQIEVLRQDHSLKLFGNLINMILPIHVNSDGALVTTISKHMGMDMEKENYTVDGSILNKGLILKSEWAGNGQSDDVRILGDFGARLYYIKKVN